VSFKRTGDDLELWLTNDTPQNISSRLHVTFRTFRGDIIWQKTPRVSVPPNATCCVERLSLSRFSTYDPSVHYFHAALDLTNDNCEQRYFLLEPKHLRLPRLRIHTRTFQHARGELLVQVTAGQFAKDVYLDVSSGDAFFEDNFFDLDAGTSKAVLVRSNLSPARLSKHLLISSLNNRT
jgi:hypothetical protein